MRATGKVDIMCKVGLCID